MNTALMFSKASDEWSTPQDFFDALDAEFSFDLDVAASRENHKCGFYFTMEDDALAQDWARFSPSGFEFLDPPTCFMNPPYSRCREFIAKAALEAERGATVVCLVPSRTDTRWWHEHVWDRQSHLPWPGVEIRFVKGRLRFGGAPAGAPFPSVVIVFRPVA